MFSVDAFQKADCFGSARVDQVGIMGIAVDYERYSGLFDPVPQPSVGEGAVMIGKSLGVDFGYYAGGGYMVYHAVKECVEP